MCWVTELGKEDKCKVGCSKEKLAIWWMNRHQSHFHCLWSWYCEYAPETTAFYHRVGYHVYLAQDVERLNWNSGEDGEVTGLLNWFSHLNKVSQHEKTMGMVNRLRSGEEVIDSEWPAWKNLRKIMELFCILIVILYNQPCAFCKTQGTVYYRVILQYIKCFRWRWNKDFFIEAYSQRIHHQ